MMALKKNCFNKLITIDMSTKGSSLTGPKERCQTKGPDLILKGRVEKMFKDC